MSFDSLLALTERLALISRHHVAWPLRVLETQQDGSQVFRRGPRAYAGVAASYGKFVAENWQRLTDDEWAGEIQEEDFPDVEWLGPVLGP